MSLLTDQEIHDADPAPHNRFDQERIDFARAIEQAVIAKLATVGVEPCAFCDDNYTTLYVSEDIAAAENAAIMLYTAEALAAARVEALEECKADLADALCADCENGVKHLNEQVAEKFRKEYPTIAGVER